MKILNLTQHKLSPTQIADGAFEPNELDKISIQKLLTFIPPSSIQPPTVKEMEARANELMKIAKTYSPEGVLLAGAPCFGDFLYYLKIASENSGFETMFSFTEIEVKEEHLSDGTIKTSFLVKDDGFFKA